MNLITYLKERRDELLLLSSDDAKSKIEIIDEILLLASVNKYTGHIKYKLSFSISFEEDIRKLEDQGCVILDVSISGGSSTYAYLLIKYIEKEEK